MEFALSAESEVNISLGLFIDSRIYLSPHEGTFLQEHSYRNGAKHNSVIRRLAPRSWLALQAPARQNALHSEFHVSPIMLRRQWRQP